MSDSKGWGAAWRSRATCEGCPRSALLTHSPMPRGLVMDADLDTLALALYVKIDELLIGSPERTPRRPAVGIPPRISDAEPVTLAVMQALLSFTSQARWLRHARAHLAHLAHLAHPVSLSAPAAGLQQAAAQARGH